MRIRAEQIRRGHVILLGGKRHPIVTIDAVIPGREGYLGIAKADDGWGYALWAGHWVQVETP